MGKRVLVTGGTGFIGSHLVEWLLKKNYEVFCLVRNPARLRWLKGLPVYLIIGDCQAKDLRLPQVEVVYHVAGVVKAKRPSLFYNVNYKGTVNLAQAVLKQKLPLKYFIFISTLAVCADSLSHYAHSKLLAEKELLKLPLPLIIFRPTAIYGPRDKEFLSFCRLIKYGLAPILNPEGILSFCYIDDLIEILGAVLEKEIPSKKIFAVSDGKAYSWEEALKIVASALQKRPIYFKIPKKLTYILALIFEKFNIFIKEPIIFNQDKLKEIFHKNWFCDISEIQKLLGYTPKYDLFSGMVKTINWYQRQGWI